MSLTVPDGSTITKDPSDIVVKEFDWSDYFATGVSISTSSWTLTGIKGDVATTPMTKDQASILAGNRSTQIRLSAGAAGSTWELSNTVVSDESPAQTINRKVLVRVENQ